MNQVDRRTLEMALVGFEAERQKIDSAMASLRNQIGGRTADRPAINLSRSKRVLSAAAKRRIAAGQRKRWAAFHAGQNAAKSTAPKRKLSAAVRAKLAKNLVKARAARAAKAKRMAA